MLAAMGTGLLTFRANFTHTGGERGRIVAIMVLRTGLQGVCHIGSCFPQPWTSPSRAAEGALTSPESGASTLSASGCWVPEATLILGFWGSGKKPGRLPQAWARGRDSGADKRLAQSSHPWALLSAGTSGTCLLPYVGAQTP